MCKPTEKLTPLSNISRPITSAAAFDNHVQFKFCQRFFPLAISFKAAYTLKAGKTPIEDLTVQYLAVLVSFVNASLLTYWSVSNESL